MANEAILDPTEIPEAAEVASSHNGLAKEQIRILASELKINQTTMVGWYKRLASNIVNWDQIEAPEEVKSWITDGVPIDFHVHPEPFYIQNPKYNKHEQQFLQAEVGTLCKDGAIKMVDYKPKFVSPLKCVPKKEAGKFRMVMNLTHLNKYVCTPKFQYDSFKMVADTIQSDDQFTSFDLRNGFYHCPLSAYASQYFGFCFQGKYYIWLVCPFGWSSSPYYFHKLLRPVKQFLSVNGIRSSIFVDDTLIPAQKKFITDHTDFAVTTFTDLGFDINYPKSQLDPVYSIEYVGYIYDSRGPDGVPWVYISTKRLNKLKRDVNKCLRTGKIQARFLAKVCGQGIAMARALLPTKFKLRPLYALLSTRKSWNETMFVSDSAREALIWWRDAASTWNGSPLHERPITAQVYTDSSGAGWGASYNEVEAAGSWDEITAGDHINFKELLAILYALLCFKNLLRNQAVQFLCDSTTAVSYIRNMGGPISRYSVLAETIWDLAYRNNIIIQSKHLAGRLNTEADRLSRLSLQYEWKMVPVLFQQIDNLFGPHTIDRFASMSTAQLPRYNSQYADPLTSGVDALAQQDWAREVNFVNAPFRMISRVLDIIIAQKAHATIIAPHWPSQPWYQKLLDLSISPPVRLKLNGLTVIKFGETAEPLHNRRWKISAWRVYGGLH